MIEMFNLIKKLDLCKITGDLITIFDAIRNSQNKKKLFRCNLA